MRTRRKRRVVHGKLTFPPTPEPPAPGCWKVMQRHGPDVLQWAWTCPDCEKTEYVLCQPPRVMEPQTRREKCPGGCGATEVRWQPT